MGAVQRKKIDEEESPKTSTKTKVIIWTIVGVIVAGLIVFVVLNGSGVWYTDQKTYYPISDAEDKATKHIEEDVNYYRQHWDTQINIQYPNLESFINYRNKNLTNEILLNSLTIDKDLSTLAKSHANELAMNDGYTTSNSNEVVYRYIEGMNNKDGYVDSSVTVSLAPIYTWITNDKSREVLFNPDWTKMGVGVTYANGCFYISVIFG